jgi:hypothetical protein
MAKCVRCGGPLDAKAVCAQCQSARAAEGSSNPRPAAGVPSLNRAVPGTAPEGSSSAELAKLEPSPEAPGSGNADGSVPAGPAAGSNFLFNGLGILFLFGFFCFLALLIAFGSGNIRLPDLSPPHAVQHAVQEHKTAKTNTANLDDFARAILDHGVYSVEALQEARKTLIQPEISSNTLGNSLQEMLKSRTELQVTANSDSSNITITDSSTGQKLKTENIGCYMLTCHNGNPQAERAVNGPPKSEQTKMTQPEIDDKCDKVARVMAQSSAGLSDPQVLQILQEQFADDDRLNGQRFEVKEALIAKFDKRGILRKPGPIAERPQYIIESTGMYDLEFTQLTSDKFMGPRILELGVHDGKAEIVH